MIRIILILLGREIIQQHWKTLLVVGGLWLCAGLLIVIDAVDGKTVIPSQFFGYFLLPEALLSLIAAAGSQGTARKMRFVQGIALFLVAMLILSATPASNFTLAIVFGICFLVDGSVRIGSAWVVRYPRWRAGLAGGIFEVFIAIVTLQPWPTWYAGTVAINVGAVMTLTGFAIISIALQIRRLNEGASLSAVLGRNRLLDFTDLPLRYKIRDRSELIVHVWTPTGTAMTPLSQRVINRYIAAVDSNGVISTGHAALEMVPSIYISHYPAVELDRSPDQFTRTLRATSDNDVPGRFLESYEKESSEWCPSTVQVSIQNIDRAKLLAFWDKYSKDNTYNLTNRNCSTAVADALDAALEGVYREHRRPVVMAFRAIVYPELWAAGLIRKRAESMAWTPGLVLDYARALSAIVDPQANFFTLSKLRLVKKYAGNK